MTLASPFGLRPETFKDEPPRPRWARTVGGRTWAPSAEGPPRHTIVMSNALEHFPYGNPEWAPMALLKFLAARPLTVS
jgi:hypothetical protein